MNIKKVVSIGMVGCVCIGILIGIVKVLTVVTNDATSIIIKITDKCCDTVESLVASICNSDK